MRQLAWSLALGAGLAAPRHLPHPSPRTEAAPRGAHHGVRVRQRRTPADTVSRAAIARAVAALVRIDTVPGPNGRDSVRVAGFSVDRIDSGSVLAPFLRQHGGLVWYLATHTAGAGARIVEAPSDSRAVRDSIVRALRDSGRFNDALLRMLAAYWTPTGRVVAGRAGETDPAPVPEPELRQVAARFFYPDGASATGDTLFTHVCAGTNGLGDLPRPVDPVVEAFAFDAVRSEFFRPGSPLMQAFQAAFARAKAVSVSRDAATRVRRAQGALWLQLEQDPALAAALRVAYARHQQVLPFRLTPAGS